MLGVDTGAVVLELEASDNEDHELDIVEMIMRQCTSQMYQIIVMTSSWSQLSES